ncbi:MAG: ACT domain-containing protein [Pseudomonadota bacterium]
MAQATGKRRSGGETDLARLLSGLTPTLRPEVFVFATLDPGADAAALDPILTFREAEGLTAVAERGAAEAAGLEAVYPCRMITLEVHSALEAVGLLAAVSARLAAIGVSVNVVSAFHHDHLFVPEAEAERALAALRDLAGGARPLGSDS